MSDATEGLLCSQLRALMTIRNAHTKHMNKILIMRRDGVTKRINSKVTALVSET